MDQIKLEFLKEEYNANWAYIKHQEDIRLRLHQLYLTLVAALLSVFAVLFKLSSSKSIGEFLIEFAPVAVAMCGFISVYGWLYVWFMFNQKNSYEKYRSQNIKIRQIIYTSLELAELHESVNSISSKGLNLRSAFVAWASLPILLSVTSTVLAGYFFCVQA
ncbi:hypothetical protein FJN13_10015 [Alteromonas mediterranea]|uniref:hypothetical protein n=1 Tax=Alteromonas mediterranea TaxID=314275 RepID=UPI00112FE074|nr:hypothetical protein [Alteromonas mediterranea]QDG35102.1 hypothetical protein FJN13_10015 [Alteromonas mediterranea]